MSLAMKALKVGEQKNRGSKLGRKVVLRAAKALA